MVLEHQQVGSDLARAKQPVLGMHTAYPKEEEAEPLGAMVPAEFREPLEHEKAGEGRAFPAHPRDGIHATPAGPPLLRWQQETGIRLVQYALSPEPGIPLADRPKETIQRKPVIGTEVAMCHPFLVGHLDGLAI